MQKREKKRILLFILLNGSILAVSLFYNFLFEQKLLSVFSEGCEFKNLFGFFCPGCGGSRSLNALLNFKLIRSFLYFPAIPYTSFLILIIDIKLFLSIIKGDGAKYSIGYKPFVLIPVIIMLNFIIKNILLLGFGIDLL